LDRVLIGKLRRHRVRLTKFGVVGLVGLVADAGTFNVLRYAGGRGPLYDLPLTAKVISTALGIVVAWLGHRFWTFSEQRRTAVRREFVVFVVVYVIGLVITIGCLALTHYLLDLRSAIADNVSGNVVGLGLAMAFRYWAMHKHVFTGRPRGSSHAPHSLAASSRAAAAGAAAQTVDPPKTGSPAVEPQVEVG
jgi:putative flippase GtrA